MKTALLLVFLALYTQAAPSVPILYYRFTISDPKPVLKTTGDDNQVFVQGGPEGQQEIPFFRTQYHAQDPETGVYRVGHEFPQRIQTETRSEDGIVQGAFAYVDANGEPVEWRYIATPKGGFVVDASNLTPDPQFLPQPVGYTPEVAAARAEFFQLYAAAAAAAAAAPDDNEPANVNVYANQEQNQYAPQFQVPHRAQFAVPSHVVRDAGSISNLAVTYGASPVAAVHDAQVNPATYTGEQIRPVLVHQDDEQTAVVYHSANNI